MKNSPYTDAQLQFIKDNCRSCTRAELVERFNIYFNDTRSVKSIEYALHQLNCHCIPIKNTWACKFTDEQKQFMQDNATAMTRKELTSHLNSEFGTSFSVNTVKGWCVRNGLYALSDGRFTSDTSPRWQKGLDIDAFKSHYTADSFAAMTQPMKDANKVHKLGDIVIRHARKYIVVSEDYTLPFDKRLELYSHHIYKQHGGSIPNDHIILHLDNDYMNCDIENLICIPKRYRAFLRHYGWWTAPPEVKLTALKWCELYYALK